MPYNYVILIISFVIVIRMQIVCEVLGMVASFLKRRTGSGRYGCCGIDSIVYHLVTYYVQGSQIQNLLPTRLSGKVRQQMELIPDPANSHSYFWSGVVLSEQYSPLWVSRHPELTPEPTWLSLQQLKAFIAPAPPPSCWP